MVSCLERGVDFHMAQLMPQPLTVSCSNKIQIGFTFLVPAYLGSPRQRGAVCVCKVAFVSFCIRKWIWTWMKTELLSAVFTNIAGSELLQHAAYCGRHDKLRSFSICSILLSCVCRVARQQVEVYILQWIFALWWFHPHRSTRCGLPCRDNLTSSFFQDFRWWFVCTRPLSTPAANVNTLSSNLVMFIKYLITYLIKYSQRIFLVSTQLQIILKPFVSTFSPTPPCGFYSSCLLKCPIRCPVIYATSLSVLHFISSYID